MSAGTFLDDLDKQTPISQHDQDLVQSIMQDMSGRGRPQALPPPAGNGAMINSPNPNTTFPLAMDATAPTAHLIGKDQPTPADFARMAHYHGQYAPAQYPAAPAQPPAPSAPTAGLKGTWAADLVYQFRQPILVAVIVFLVCLPAVSILIGVYMPSLISGTGALTTGGQLVRACLGGVMFWAFVNVVAPLVGQA